MRGKFGAHYRPTEAEFAQLWREAAVVPDTNVLLNLYRYTPHTRDELLRVLRRLASRLWLPHQCAVEFHADRVKVLHDQAGKYDALVKEVSSLRGNLAAVKSSRRHPIILNPTSLAAADASLKAVIVELEESKKKQLGFFERDFFQGDTVLEAVTDLFPDARVGEPYDEARLKTVCEIAEKRAIAKIPPGYRDEKKEGLRRYGDYVIWSQMLDYARTTKKPVLFVTDDAKEDWWQRFNGRTIGPRPELLTEMAEGAGVAFYMYSADQFMTYANTYLGEKVPADSIAEVRAVKKEEEEAAQLTSDPTHSVAQRPSAEQVAGLQAKHHLLTQLRREVAATLELQRALDNELRHTDETLVDLVNAKDSDQLSRQRAELLELRARLQAERKVVFTKRRQLIARHVRLREQVERAEETLRQGQLDLFDITEIDSDEAE